MIAIPKESFWKCLKGIERGSQGVVYFDMKCLQNQGFGANSAELNHIVFLKISEVVTITITLLCAKYLAKRALLAHAANPCLPD